MLSITLFRIRGSPWQCPCQKGSLQTGRSRTWIAKLFTHSDLGGPCMRRGQSLCLLMLLKKQIFTSHWTTTRSLSSRNWLTTSKCSLWARPRPVTQTQTGSSALTTLACAPTTPSPTFWNSRHLITSSAPLVSQLVTLWQTSSRTTI